MSLSTLPTKTMPESTDLFSSRILIVDDQESNLRLLGYALRREGYVAVSSTSDPLAVCALHLENRFALILLDLQMPRMNGFQVLEALGKIEGEPVAVLVLSADAAQLVRSLEAGASDFLPKPLVLAEVMRRIRIILEKTMAPGTAETTSVVETTSPDAARARAIG